ncbi:GDP-mannose 4,6-dehydratase [Candidatus Microgenomates bacterium]|nr:GDP-mannose 4,6-dehydratase [Candidatus Microgenomates bacterium]
MFKENRTALITGASGMDGTYLTDLLLNEGYQVIGITRKPPIHPRSKVTYAHWDFQTASEPDMAAILRRYRPSHIFHLAAVSSSVVASSRPDETLLTNVGGTTKLMNAVLQSVPDSRFLFVSSSGIFGPPALESPQTERTPMVDTARPYALSKILAHRKVWEYREKYGLCASVAITYNHEGPTRSINFITGKIAKAAALISSGINYLCKLFRRKRKPACC